MLIGINAEDLRDGDVIRTTSGVSGKVMKCLGFQQRLNMMAFHLDCMGDQVLLLRVLEIVELLHRPRHWQADRQSELEALAVYAEKAAEVVRKNVAQYYGAMGGVDELHKALKALHFSIEYELLTTSVDRHMTP